MNLKRRLPTAACLLHGAAFAWMAALTPVGQAATIWDGPLVTYHQPGTTPTQAANQDRLTDNVWLTRASRDRLFNAKTESFCTRGASPADTEWATGTLAKFNTLAYKDFSSWVDGLGGGNVSPKILNVNAVVHLISDDVYLSVKFTAWGALGSGHFTYQRSTPPIVVPPPTVSITSPSNGAVYAAPATVNITATAAVSSGSVTNVTFFGNNAPLASAQAAPFGITTGNLSAGSYSLAAVATAAGVSSTSSIVNITVVSPVAISLFAQKITDNQFSFDYAADPGLSYVVQGSSNLVDWLPVLTNAPASNPAHFTDGFNPTGVRYYRVGLLPNP